MIGLTFDTDWMSPCDLDAFLHRYPNLPNSSFFVHEASQGWEAEGHETGPHPTVDSEYLASIDTAERVPRGLGIRSHSCHTSHMLSLAWARQGFLYQSNETHLYGPGEQPWQTAWGIWEVPICYMDNMDLWFARNWGGNGREPLSARTIDEALGSTDLYVMDFHPIHIAFNTQSPEHYASLRGEMANGRSAWELASPGWGVRDFFELLLQRMEEERTPSTSLARYVQTLA